MCIRDRYMGGERRVYAEGEDDSSPVIAKGVSSRIIHPKFMKRTGTMCITELWSDSEKKKVMSSEYAKQRTIKLLMSDESLHRFLIKDKNGDILYRPKPGSSPLSPTNKDKKTRVSLPAVETLRRLNGPQPVANYNKKNLFTICLLYTSPSPRDGLLSRMPSSA
eukprot:TRINITY_DN6502_c0_g1_i1.p1 TRINITY_DN6502_c0_g1~~TRINITY_DN6502_c0_g1_i1.p1  ORF type:complete len:183 (+),score=52.61 TRINITY_DN6502_c0_g1_i1:60-551(+)